MAILHTRRADDVEQLAGLIKSLAERCDRLARSSQDGPTFEVTQASRCLHQAMINLTMER